MDIHAKNNVGFSDMKPMSTQMYNTLLKYKMFPFDVSILPSSEIKVKDYRVKRKTNKK